MIRGRFILLKLTSRLLAIGVTAAVTTVAFAQTAAPQPTLKRVPAPWIGYLIIAVLLIMVLGVSLMPSKRSHQD